MVKRSTSVERVSNAKRVSAKNSKKCWTDENGVEWELIGYRLMKRDFRRMVEGFDGRDLIAAQRILADAIETKLAPKKPKRQLVASGRES